MERYTDKVVLITGAGGFLGSACALRLASEGGRIAVCDVNPVTLEKTVEAIHAQGGEAKGYVTDVADPAAVNKLVDDVVADFGGLDVSIHVAGGSARIAGPNARFTNFVEQEDYVIDRVLKVNLYGALYLARAAARVMIRQGRGGRILSFSSSVGFNGLVNATEYAAAKGGVIAFTKALAKEVGQYGITVNSVAPGIVCRPENADNLDYQYKTNFLGDKCLPEHIAGLVAYMASDEARFITGQTYLCDGGRTLCMKGSE